MGLGILNFTDILLIYIPALKFSFLNFVAKGNLLLGCQENG